MANEPITTTDAWNDLRGVTSARIALGRAGGSLPTAAWLDFKSAHAAARDAVHHEFRPEELARELGGLGLGVIPVRSEAADRATFLQRPDLGRRLDAESRSKLAELKDAARAFDLVLIVSDGLSALAAERHAAPLLAAILPRLAAEGWSLAPLVIAPFGRVALEDDIGEAIGARMALVLLGERPGLGSPDSLGAYFVFGPRVGKTDADRNCISNIRPEGLAIAPAAETLHYLLTESRARKLSGVELKDGRALSGPAVAAALP